MTNASEAALTDDEIAALSYGKGHRWRAALPTIDRDDDMALAAAVFRGQRSLVARGLAAPGARPPEDVDGALATMVTTATHGEVLVSAFTADRELTFDPAGFTYLNYQRPDDETVLVEIVTAIGLHRFGALDADEAASALIELVRAVHEGSPPPKDSEVGAVNDTFCLALPVGDSVQRRIFAIGPATVESAVLSPAELEEVSRRTVPLERVNLADVLTAVERTYGIA